MMNPSLRFPEFEKKWADITIKEAAQQGGLKTGPFGAQLKAEEYVDDESGIPVVMPKDIRAGRIVLDTIARVSQEKAEKLSNHRLEDRDILFPRRGELGRIGLLSSEQRGWLCGTGCLRLRLSPRAFPSFFATTLRRSSSVQWLESNAVGQTMLNLNTSIIGDLPIRVPTLPEQKKIADFLTSVDDRIGQLIKKKALLQDYKKGVMQQLFSQQIRFKDDNGNDFPDWEEKKLGELGKFTGGGTPETGNDSYWSGDIPWISSSDILESSITKINKYRFITQEAIDGSATKLVPVNSILFISRVGVGKLAVSKEEVCTSQDFTNFTPLKDHLEYLGYYFTYNQNLLKRYAQGTSIKGITSQELRKIAVSRPSLPEQKKIADFLTSIDQKIERVSLQITETQTFKKGLLQQMFV